jgi:cold shock CspA family protein
VRPQHTGRVVAFDTDRGRGEIEADDGTRLAFHCTQVADGSRTVPVGAPVRYVVLPGSLGAWEASEVAPTSG